MGWVLFALALGALIGWPILEERARLPAEYFRSKAPGRFAKLSQGVTHYQWLGPTRGPVIVAVHGLTTPSPVWYAIAGGLGKLGYRVLIYDLYGRGFSDAPRGAQNRAFFIRQINDLLKHQEIEGDVTFLGYSMGGSIVSAFAETHPEKVSRLMLLASGGIWLREDRLTAYCKATPFLGDWLHAAVAARRMRRELRRGLGKTYDIKGIRELQLAEFQSRGFLRSVLSSRRHMLDEEQMETHRKIGRDGIPVVAVWAEKDDVIPLRSLGTLTQWNRLVRQEVVQGAGHDVAFTHADEVVQILRDVLREEA